MGWQPVETAPKDGTPVLVFADVRGWEDCGRSRVVAFHDGYGWQAYGPAFGEPVANRNPFTKRSPQVITICQPVYWMPLPDLPDAP